MKFGPGTLKIGETATAVDVSCLVNGAVISAEKDEGDTRTALCGTVRPGTTSYSWTLAGNMDIDPEDPDGIFMLSSTAYGTELPFVFTPNTVGQVTATGVLVLDPLDFGNSEDDAYGSAMTSDFEFSLVGEPTYSPTIPVGDALEALWATVTDRRGPKNQVEPAPAAEPVTRPKKTTAPASA
jgi:hypothetical protein